MLHHWIQYLLLVCAACFAAVWFEQDAFLLFPAFLLLLPLLTVILLFLSRRRIVLSLQAVGEDDGVLWLHYTIQNNFAFPVTKLCWRIVLRKSTDGVAQYQYACGAAKKKEKNRISMCFKEIRTGYITVETDYVRLYDALGLFSIRCAAPPAEEVLIYPKIVQVHLINDEVQPNLDESTSYSMDRAGQDVSEIFAMHEYVEGDDVRKIHWKLSSKTGKLIVREFGLPVGKSVTVLLESRIAAERQGDALSTCFDAVVSLAVTLLQHRIAYNLLWLDADGMTLHCAEIQDWDDLQEVLPALLRVEGRDTGASALGNWLTDPQRAFCRVLYYVAAWADAKELDEISGDGQAELHLAFAGEWAVSHDKAACVALLSDTEAVGEFTI